MLIKVHAGLLPSGHVLQSNTDFPGFLSYATVRTVWTNFTAVGHVTKSVGVKTTCTKKKEKWKAV